MKQKKWFKAFTLSLASLFAFGMVACEKDKKTETPPETPPTQQGGSQSGGSQSGGSQSGGSQSGGSQTPVDTKPTAAKVVAARNQAEEAERQAYDFTLNFSGDVSALGFSKGLDGNYDCQYRYNKTTNELTFKRVTSGALLYDSTEYLYSVGDNTVNLNINEKGEVKKLSVVPEEDKEITMVNLPFVKIVDALEEDNIGTIQELSSGKYGYETTLTLGENNALVNKALGLIGKFGLNMSVVGATGKGMKMQFNYQEGQPLNDFKFELSVEVPLKKIAKAEISISYEQKSSNAQISLPSADGFITQRNEIESELNTINDALLRLKQDESYSLDLLAKNEFDPSAFKLATVDSYTARMYKNTVDEKVVFNHSYTYKAHHEEDGAESYKYTVGNLQDGTVHEVSRKGSNVDTPLTDVTADTQFDYLVSPFIQSAANVDCIKKETEDGVTRFHIYINKNKTVGVQNRILDIVNSNDAEGVVDVNNYFNNEAYTVRESELVVEMSEGNILSVSYNTELKYTPTGGEFTDYNVTLNNRLELKINDKLTDAQEYEAPKKALATLGFGGLDWIL